MALLRPKSQISIADEISLRDIHPDLQLKISPRAKRIALRLDTSARKMNLVVPKRFSMARALDFAIQHKNWIDEKLGELPQIITLENGSTIPLLGRDRKLNISYDITLKRTSIILNDNEILISTNLENPTPRLKRFLKKEAENTMANLAREKAATINKTISDVHIRDTKSRWGSCSPDGRIMLSWRLIFAPWDAMDYVVAHEVAHLEHMNHGREFWRLCESLCDNYKSGKIWMRSNGHELLRYG